MLWNTRYLDAAITALDDDNLADDDIIRLSPLGSAHINLLGRYHFEPVTRHDLRPLGQT